MNDLRAFFERRAVEGGKGIWKWHHYFDIYDRHFSKFRGLRPRVLEIGVYSGGSLEMWADYFGSDASIIGVDKVTCPIDRLDGNIRILIGDQSNPDFWRNFRRVIPPLDIVIDDGSHLSDDQWNTFVTLLPHLKDGGVYLCEDVHNHPNLFANGIFSVASQINSVFVTRDEKRGVNVHQTFDMQRILHSIHYYPYVIVVEKNAAPVEEFVSSKSGTEWKG